MRGVNHPPGVPYPMSTLIDTLIGLAMIPILVVTNLVSFIKDAIAGAPTL